MKQRYVVDLNVVRFAQTLRDEKGRKTLDSMRLLTEMVARCHSLVICPELFRMYSELADELKASGVPQGLSIFALAATAAAVSEKWLYSPQPKAVKGEERIPSDDRLLVRLAVSSRADLVTTDGRLATAITTTAFHKEGRLKVLSVQQALAQVLGS